ELVEEAGPGAVGPGAQQVEGPRRCAGRPDHVPGGPPQDHRREEGEGGPGLVLGRGRQRRVVRQGGEGGGRLRCPEGLWVAELVEVNEPAGPIDVGLPQGGDVAAGAQRVGEAVQQARRAARGGWGGGIGSRHGVTPSERQRWGGWERVYPIRAA